MPWIPALLFWLACAVVAVAAGAARELLLAPRLGAHAAHVAGTLAVCVLFLAAMGVFFRLVPPGTAAQQWMLGAFWCLLTVTFEFGFGHFVMGHSWSALLADYNLLRGRLWVLVLLTLLSGPRLWGTLLA
jgi:hypothetical protein